MITKRLLALTAMMAMLTAAGFAAQTGLWQFDGDLTADVGMDNAFLGTPLGSTAFFGDCSDFGAPLVDSSDEQVLYVRKFAQEVEGLVVKGNMPANGGGAYCNQWTLVFDYATTNSLVDAFTAGFHSLWDTNPDPAGGNTAGEFFIRQATAPELGAGGQGGGYYAAFSSFTDVTNWHRIACVVDSAVGYMKVYVDGALVGTMARNQLIATRPDGTYSLYTGTSGPNQGSLLMFCTGSSNFNAAGFINSLAIYDEPLSPSQIEELGTAAPGGIPSGVPTGNPELVRHSEFIGYYVGDNNAKDGGDVSTAWSINGTFMGAFGWIRYATAYDGSLRMNHPDHNWDDPYIDVETTGTIDVYTPIAINEQLEAVVEFVPEFDLAGDDQYVEVLFTDRGLGWTDGTANCDVQFRLWLEDNDVLWVEFNQGPTDGPWVALDEAPTSITSVVVHTTYNPVGTEWRCFYRINTIDGPGTLTEAPGSPVVFERTKTAFRVESEQAFTTNGELFWDLYIKDLKIYNVIQTLGPEPPSSVPRWWQH